MHPGQKDSDILPPYEVVDAILYRMIEEGQHREEIVNAGFDSEVVEKIHAMIMRTRRSATSSRPYCACRCARSGTSALCRLPTNTVIEGGGFTD